MVNCRQFSAPFQPHLLVLILFALPPFPVLCVSGSTTPESSAAHWDFRDDPGHPDTEYERGSSSLDLQLLQTGSARDGKLSSC